jgi:hypothetical protein
VQKLIVKLMLSFAIISLPTLSSASEADPCPNVGTAYLYGKACNTFTGSASDCGNIKSCTAECVCTSCSYNTDTGGCVP